jgi:hypothetical protein
VQVHQRPACPARVELDAHLVTDARGTPHLPPAQVAVQVAAGLRAERSDRPAGRQPLPGRLAPGAAWLVPGLWQHPEEAAQGLVNDPVLTADVDGQPGTGIGQQPPHPSTPIARCKMAMASWRNETLSGVPPARLTRAARARSRAV